jgi:hypothetical protein
VSDNLKDATVAVLSLALIAGFARHRAEHAIVHDLSRSMKGGTLRAEVRPHGLFGILVGQADTARITGTGFNSDGNPFQIVRGSGVRANVRHLELDFTDITLRGTPVKHFRTSLPAVTLDVVRALADERIILRTAGEGTAEAEVDAHGLEVFLAKKFPQLTEVKVTLKPGVAQLNTVTVLFGIKSSLEAVGKLSVSEGRYVSIVDPVIMLNGKPTTPQFALSILKMVNPVLDTEKDLGLGETFYATDIVVGEGTLTVHGKARIPVQKKADRP